MSKKIMVVEDQFHIARVMELYLKSEGFAVVVVNDSKAAVNKAIEEKPDVITLDVVMPDVHGMEVFKKLRQTPETANIPVVFVTVVRATDLLPADGYLNKPFTKKELLNIIKKLDH